MIGLCIAEPYYLLGMCRIEYFADEGSANAYRSKLNQGVITWFLGEPVPKRKSTV